MSENYFKTYPNTNGFFEEYGGMFIPPVLETEMKKIADAYYRISKSHDFIQELRSIRKHYQGRPTPVYFCNRLSEKYGGRIYLKREDLNHTGAHKLNHCMGEALLAKHLGKKKLIAETGAGQHGVALATAAAYFGLECEIHMGEVDIAKEHPNVVRMEILGAKVVPVTHGLKTLKEAVDSAFEEYLKDPINTIYCIGSVVGPHPFPMLVREFQRVVGIEAREQFLEMTGELPDNLVACVGGGSNAMGIFSSFLDDSECSIYGVEPGGRDLNVIGEHAATITHGKPGVLHGFKSYMLQDEQGEPSPVYSVASGLDYPSVGPEHSMLHDWGRVEYTSVSDDETIDAFYELSRFEGIIPALESAHAVAFALKLAKEKPNQSILINLSGRGDKDIDFVVDTFGLPEGVDKVEVEIENKVEAKTENEIKDEHVVEPALEEIEVEKEAEIEIEAKVEVEEIFEVEEPAEVIEETVEEEPEILDFIAEEEVKTEVEDKIEDEVEEEVAAEPIQDEKVEDEKEDETEKQVIVDRFQSKASVMADKSQAISDIKKAISVMDRFLYMKELFANSQDDFNDALDAINSAGTLQEAVDYLSKFNWDDNDTSEQFMKLVLRRFS